MIIGTKLTWDWIFACASCCYSLFPKLQHLMISVCLQAALNNLQERRQRSALEAQQREQLLSRRFTANDATPQHTSIEVDHHSSLQNAHRGVDDMITTGKQPNTQQAIDCLPRTYPKIFSSRCSLNWELEPGEAEVTDHKSIGGIKGTWNVSVCGSPHSVGSAKTGGALFARDIGERVAIFCNNAKTKVENIYICRFQRSHKSP